MKRKIAVLAIAAIIGISFAACKGSSTVQTSSVSSTASKSESITITATPQVTEAVEELITIGAKTDNSYEVKLVNKTGKDIKGVYVKTTSQTEFADNLIAENTVWENEKKADIFYAEKKTEDNTANANEAGTDAAASSQEFALEDGYDIKLTLSDDTEYILHAFPCDDIEEGEVYIDDTENVAYLKYNSISTKEAIETKEAEIATKKNAESEAQAQVQAQTETQAQTEAQAAAEEAQAQAEAQAAAEAAQAQAQAEAQAAAEAAQAQAQAQAEAQARAEQAAAEAAQQQQTQANNNANGCGDDFAFN